MPYRYEDYPQGELPWLDRPDAVDAIERRVASGELTRDEGGWLHKWVADGYVVFENMFDVELAAAINADVQEILDEFGHLPIAERAQHFKNAYRRSEATRRALVLPELLRRLDLLLGKRVIPHQTLNLPVSSQQGAHSDQVLMTTHPIGYMCAVWFALEDVDDECGPLFVHPKSHRLPYISASSVGLPAGASEEERGRVYDASYYDRVGRMIEECCSEKFTFLPKCGDVLIWHSNLLHGAQLVERTGATRKSLIAHYFAQDVEHYSDLFERPCESPDLRPR